MYNKKLIFFFSFFLFFIFFPFFNVKAEIVFEQNYSEDVLTDQYVKYIHQTVNYTDYSPFIPFNVKSIKTLVEVKDTELISYRYNISQTADYSVCMPLSTHNTPYDFPAYFTEPYEWSASGDDRRIFSLLIYKTPDCSGPLDYYYADVYGNAENPLAGRMLYPLSYTFDAFFQMYDSNILAELKILDPITDSYVPQTTVTISGECPINGENRLKLIRDFYFSYPSEAGHFDIDCIDNEFETEYDFFGSSSGPFEIILLDLDWLEEKTTQNDNLTRTSIILNTYPDSGEWGLFWTYPDCTNECRLKEGDWIFRVGYKVPLELDPYDILFLAESCDSDFTNCIQEDSGNLYNIDPDLNGFIQLEEYFDETKYYKFSLLYESLYKYQLSKIIYLDNTNGLDPTPPPTDDFGYWGNLFRQLFYPKKTTLRKFTDNLPELISNTKPLGYFYSFFDYFSKIGYSEEAIDVKIETSIAGTDFTMPILSSTDSNISNLKSIYEPYLIFAIWLWVSFHIIHRVKDDIL